MPWTVEFDPDYKAEVDALRPDEQLAVIDHAAALAKLGPAAKRPLVGTLRGSEFSNLKELRFTVGGLPWRVLFCFDRARSAILLVGGCKAGDNRFYERLLPVAESRYRRHLANLKKPN